MSESSKMFKISMEHIHIKAHKKYCATHSVEMLFLYGSPQLTSVHNDLFYDLFKLPLNR